MRHVDPFKKCTYDKKRLHLQPSFFLYFFLDEAF